MAGTATATLVQVDVGPNYRTTTNRELSPERHRSAFRSLLLQQASKESQVAFTDRRRRTTAPELGAPDDSSAVVIAADKEPGTRVASFTPMQEWDGYVLHVGRGSFFARLTDITTDGPNDVEEVELPLSELADSIARRLKVGDLFRWSIGYERTLDGQKTKVSRIVVRQLPRWRKGLLKDAEREASVMSDHINWR